MRPRRLAQGLGPGSTPLIDQCAPQMLLQPPLVLPQRALLPVYIYLSIYLSIYIYIYERLDLLAHYLHCLESTSRQLG